MLLEQENINLEARNKKGNSPLFCAICIGNLEVVKLLLEKGADINAKNDKGETSFNIASGLDNKQILELLLEKRANFASPPTGIAKVISYINYFLYKYKKKFI